MSEPAPLSSVRLGLPSRARAGSWAAACAAVLQELGAVPNKAPDSHDSIVVAGVDGSAVVRSDPPSPLAGQVVPAVLVGAHAALAALAALRLAEARGHRVIVELDAAEVIAACSGDAFVRAACPRPASTAAVDLATMACADGYVAVGHLSDRCRTDLALLAGVDPSTVTGDDMGTAVRSWLMHLTRRELMQIAELWRLPFAPVLRRDEALASAARGELGRPFEISSTLVLRPATIRTGRAGGLPLSGVVALDLGVAWSGPYCGALLRDLGARVIRVARPSGTTAVAICDDPCAGVSSDLRADKEVVELDLSTASGRDRFLALATEADVVVQNFSPRVMTNLGLGPELRKTNPSLIAVAMPAFAAASPWSQHIAYGGGLECATGLADFEPGPVPRPASVPYIDYLAGTYGAIAAVALLLTRDHTGQGAEVVVAQQAVAACVLEAASGNGSGVRYHPEQFVMSVAAELADSGFIVRDDKPHRHRARPPWVFAVDDQLPHRAEAAPRVTRAAHARAPARPS